MRPRRRDPDAENPRRVDTPTALPMPVRCSSSARSAVRRCLHEEARSASRDHGGCERHGGDLAVPCFDDRGKPDEIDDTPAGHGRRERGARQALAIVPRGPEADTEDGALPRRREDGVLVAASVGVAEGWAEHDPAHHEDPSEALARAVPIGRGSRPHRPCGVHRGQHPGHADDDGGGRTSPFIDIVGCPARPRATERDRRCQARQKQGTKGTRPIPCQHTRGRSKRGADGPGRRIRARGHALSDAIVTLVSRCAFDRCQGLGRGGTNTRTAREPVAAGRRLGHDDAHMGPAHARRRLQRRGRR